MAAEKRWLVLTVRPSDDMRDAVAEGLLALGGSAVHEHDGALISYVDAPEDHVGFLAMAQTTLNSDFEWRWQDDEDWAHTWKRGLQPRRVGRHFVVAPSWTEPEARAGDRVIIIDPEMAFGTGEHATTRGALRFLEQVVRHADRVLDVGTGSAILAIGAALCGSKEVLAVEYDEDAVLNARDNLIRNNVEGVVTLQMAMVDEKYLRPHAASFDVIAGNVLSSILRPLLPAFYGTLKPGGHLILGGILETEADDMIDAARAAGFTLKAEDLEEEWWGGLFRRP